MVGTTDKLSSNEYSNERTEWHRLMMPTRLIPVVFAFLAFTAVLAITSGYGPGLDPDSMAYAGAATSLSHGRGLQVPLGKWEQPDSTVELTLWPPAFPAAMAIPQSLGVSPNLSARLVLAASAAATLALTGLILGGALSIPALVVALTVILITPSFVAVHLSVLSEPLFIAALALTLFSMVRGRPVTAAAGATLAVMTRYAGAAAAIATAIWFLFFDRGDLKRRFARAAISSAPAALAFTLWLIHNSQVKVVQSGIAVGYHGGIASTLREGIETILSWVAPGATVAAAGFIAFIALVALAAASFAGLRRNARHVGVTDAGAPRVPAASAVLLASYLAVLICSRLFVGGAIRFDARILSPAIFLLEAVLIPLVASSFAGRARILQSVGAVAVTAWMAAAIAAEGPVVLDSIQDGNDFAASDWRESPTIDWVEHEGKRYAIYSNWPAAIFFDAHRYAFDIPTSTNPDTLARFGEILHARGGVLAAFGESNFDYPAIDSIAAGAGLVKLYTFPDGAVWASKSAAR